MKYLIDEKAHKAKNSKFFKRLNYQNASFYENEAVEFEVEHKELNIVGLFILKSAKLRTFEHNSFSQIL